MTTSPVTVPDVTVARYDAPPVYITPVLEVISSEPLHGRMKPGSYQHVLLNVKTGELSFHESTEHLEPWRKEWHAINDVPRDIWKRWHPGSPFSPNGGPHQWFNLVPELLSWTIDAGFTGHPYFDVDRANDLLVQIQPYAQALLSGLFTAGDELDWSRDSAIAGRQMWRLTRREHQAATDPHVDDDLVDYGTLIARFPYLYQPRFLSMSMAKLFDACETQTRFLGCNAGWHEEIKKVFGKPYHDGSGIGLDVLGVRSWYRTLLLGDDPRAVVEYSEWDRDFSHLAKLTATMTDEALDKWAAHADNAAADQGVRVIGVREAGEAYRRQLREKVWDRLAVVGANVAELKRQLDEATTERQQLVLDVAGWNGSDTSIADRGRMSRQAVHALRTGTPEKS